MLKSLNNTSDTRGVVLLSFGKAIFAEFAFNMALSIKRHSDLPIQLIHDGGIKDLGNRAQFFDILTEIDRDDYFKDGKLQAGLAKCSLYKYLAFDHNLYLDIDGVLFKDPSYLFEEEGNFKIQRDTLHWVEDEQILTDKYNVTDVKGSNSSVMLIRKSVECEALFGYALEAINNPIDKIKNGWFGMHPDELYLGVGMAKVGLKDIYFNEPYPIYLRKRTDTKNKETLQDIPNQNLGVGVYGNWRYNHYFSYKAYTKENESNWRYFIGMSARVKIDQLMKLKR